MKTWQITIQGIVQGVGFRPQMFRNALQSNTPIHIANSMDGVQIIFNKDSKIEAHGFKDVLLEEVPPQALIHFTELHEIENQTISEYKIIESNTGNATTILTPDMSWCDSCKKEFLDSKNRRFHFFFNSCTQCGQRYSVYQKLPFERINTTHNYPMCELCQKEYNDFQSDRAYSQLNSCQHCHFRTYLFQSEEASIENQIVIISKKINRGELVAIKGIAGFLFALDFRNREVIQYLRSIKNRPFKPFAIMAQDIEWVERNFDVSIQERDELISSYAPIVLLHPKPNFLDLETLNSLSGFSKKVGVMIAPSAYLFQICLNNGGAILATSGNISKYPIEYDNTSALNNLSKYTQNIWYYDRAIHFPQDDSVLLLSSIYSQKIILRRAKGLSPSLVTYINQNQENTILALGAQMKITFTLAFNTQLLVSPYLGTLNQVENLDYFLLYISKTLEMCQVNPDIILIDSHPQFSYRDILSNISSTNFKLFEIQHHEAHFSAILGEHHLFDTSDKVIGVICDGMGYGTSGEIWGGEIFTYENYSINKLTQFPKFHYLFNDRMSLEPKLCYFSIMIGKINSMFEDKFTPFEITNYELLLEKQPKTTSIGRVFDALAFVLGYNESKQSFEGEAAQWLDAFFIKGIETLGLEYNEDYEINEHWNWKQVFIQIETDIQNKINIETIASKFLNTFLNWIVQLVQNETCTKLAVSGGVFQNSTLIDKLIFRCQNQKIDLYLHQIISPNDENISFGQLMYYQFIINKTK